MAIFSSFGADEETSRKESKLTVINNHLVCSLIAPSFYQNCGVLCRVIIPGSRLASNDILASQYRPDLLKDECHQ